MRVHPVGIRVLMRLPITNKKLHIMSFFNKKSSAAPSTTESGSEHKSAGKLVWRSPFVDFKNKPYGLLQIKPGNDTLIRLVPTFSPRDQDYSLEVSTVAVRTKNEGTVAEGAVLAGAWWTHLEAWLFQNYRDRMHSKARNPEGDLKMRGKKRVIFWSATMLCPAEGESAIPMLRIINLAGRNYPKASPGDGCMFQIGGDYYEDFDPDNGRELLFRASLKDARDPASKQIRITPSRVAVPIKPKWMAALTDFVAMSDAERPSLHDALRQSSKEELVQALRDTLPADIADRYFAEFGENELHY